MTRKEEEAKAAARTEARMTERIHEIVESTVGRQVDSVSLHPNSNKTQVYTVTLVTGEKAKRTPKQTQHGTQPLPADTTTAILRFTDTGSDLNDEVQVQNEVAVLSLARDAFNGLDRRLVPRVYGWQAVNTRTRRGRPGWILQECMPGVPLSGDILEKMDTRQKESIIKDIAQAVHALQTFRLPESVVGYGGLNFGDDGQIVCGPTAIHGATRACMTYRELYHEYLQTQSKRMDRCDVVQGWGAKGTGLRGRIDRFIVDKFQELLDGSTERNPRPVLVHGDLNLTNLLYDPATFRVTAVLDWSFGHVASVCDEFFYSFPELGHLVMGQDSPDPEGRKCLLGQKDADKSTSEVFRLTNSAFVEAGVTRPADLMPGIATLAELYWFIQNLSPGIFYMKRIREKMSKNRLQATKRGVHLQLEAVLAQFGY